MQQEDIPFLDRVEEIRRLRRLYARKQGALAVLYGRRRCGKSRLILESLEPERLVYYFGDEREASIQRSALAAEIARQIPGFADVKYPDWDVLLGRWFREAPAGAVLAIDELPYVVAASSELPSLLQKHLESRPRSQAHLVLCGSSQRMMQGLVLDRTAPLYGRATEILHISPLPAGWLPRAFPEQNWIECVESYAAWGGIPRYWELARGFDSLKEALMDLVLSPMGVLHNEPATLLQDELAETVQSASLLHCIGQGCHRLSELAARLEKVSTTLNRPLQRLVELDLVEREKPFGALEKDSKRSYYRIGDPFLRFWYRCVGPQRSRLQARQISQAYASLQPGWTNHVASVWEDLVRAAIPALTIHGCRWGVAQRWWGPGLDRKPLEIDAVSESEDGKSLLLTSAKWRDGFLNESAWTELRRQASQFPNPSNKQLLFATFLKTPDGPDCFGPQSVLQALV